MSVIAAAIIGSAVVGAVSTYAGSKAEQKGIEKGLVAEEQMADKNLAFQREMADEQREDFAPWRDAGAQALEQIQTGIESGAFEVGKINLEDDPGYRVRMQEGVEARDASASARGRLLSGAQQKELTKFGQEQGSKEYANAYARELQKKQQRFNILSGMSGLGQASTAGQAGASRQLAQTGGNIMSQTGRVQNIAARDVGSVRSGAYEDYGTIINKAASNWLTMGT